MDGQETSEDEVDAGTSTTNAFRLAPPRYAFTAVRSKALALLEDNALPRLTLVTAPPGYGKTVMLAELFRLRTAAGPPCLWVGIDAYDSGQASAIDALEQHLGLDTANAPPVFDYRRGPSTRQRIAAIARALAALPEPVAIFIDNADLGDADANRELIDRLAFDAGFDCHLVVSCATDAPFDMRRAMMELQLRSIGPAELGFGPEEVAALFDDAGMHGYTPRTIAQVLAQTEGWPAAIRLIQVLASTGNGPASLDAPFRFEGQRLADSLFENLMSRLPGELQQFLAEIAPFASFSPELLTWSVEGPRAAGFLGYLVDRNILIVTLGEEGQWFRFHALFRRYLLRIADTVVPAERRQHVARRGAQWLERQGFIEPALDLAVQVEDSTLSVRLLEKLSWSLVRRNGYLPSFIAWADKVTRLGGMPGTEASFWLAWALVFERRYEDASAAVSDMEAKIETSSSSDAHKRLARAKAGLARIVLKLHMDDMRALQAIVPQWLEHASDADPFERGAAAGTLALALMVDNQFTAGRSAARTSMSAVAPTTSIYGRAWASNIAAAIEIAACDIDSVGDVLDDLEAQMRASRNEDTLIAAVTACVKARLLYERGELATALELAAQALPVGRTCGLLDFVWLGLEVLLPATVHAQDAPPPIALEQLRRVASDYPRRLTSLLDLALIRLHCAVGDPAHAQALGRRVGIWSQDCRYITLDDIVLENERTAAAMAGIALLTAAGEHKAAGDLIEQETATARRAGRRGAIIDLHLAQCGLHMTSGDARAVASAEPCRDLWLGTAVLRTAPARH